MTMSWSIFLQLLIGVLLLIGLGYFLFRYLNGDLTIKEQRLINEEGVFRRVPYTWNDREQIGTIYTYEITYDSGRKKIKKIRI